MTTYNFSALADDQHLDFTLGTDVLRFDSSSITASAVRIAATGTDLLFTAAGKTVSIDVASIGLLSQREVTFANGSSLQIGDGTASTHLDAYGRTYAFGSSTVGNQFWGLDGADAVQAGSGADWMVGNVALAPLNHVSRSGSAGSPTASSHADVSADGRLVVFDGDWSSFGVQNSGEGIIVKDIRAGTFSNEHRSSTGVQGGSGAGAATISADGSKVAFHAAQSGLVPGANSGALYDVYVTEVQGSGIVRASTGTGGTLAADGRSENADLSGTGRYVVFESSTSNFAAGGSTAQTDIFLKDLVTGTTTRVSTSLTGTDGNGESIHGRVSADGNYVVFESAASNLTSGDTNGRSDIFLFDRVAGKLVNLTLPIVAVGNPNNGNFLPDVAFNGSADAIVVFETARSLLAADTSNGTDIYAYNFKTTNAAERLKLVSSKADGSGVALSSEDASVSDDGRWVVFTSYSDALVPGDSNGSRDVFVKDLDTGRIALVSKSASGVAGNGVSSDAQISSGGDWIVFESSASNLAGTDANGGFTDVFRVANPLLVDTLSGGAGNDTYVLARNDTIVENSGGGTDLVQSSISYTLGANLENLTLLGSAKLNGTGNTLNNLITGNSGANTLNGGSGVDTASYLNSTAPVTVSLLLTGAQATGFGSDTLVSIESLIGSPLADRLTGNAAANRLDGSAGNDTLTGGAGNDTYVVGSSADVVVESADSGLDTVVSSVDWTLQSTLENLTLTGSTAVRGNGNGASNVLTGNAANNTMDGGAGNDTVSGGSGNDSLTGGSGNDRLDGAGGNDTMTGGEGSDTYVCDSAADVTVESGTTAGNIDSVISSVSWILQATLENLTLTGTTAVVGGGNGASNVLTGNAAGNSMNAGAGNDTVNGGGGNDTLAGGAGADLLTGGTGSDRFVFNSLVGSDTVTDFVSLTDRLSVSQSAVKVGDGDTLLEGGIVRSGPGGFATSAELAIFSANVASLSTAAAAAAIGSANSAYTAERKTALFVVDTGSSSGVFRFESADGNATVSAAELTLLATLNGTPYTVLADYLFSA
jgi:hypothetical protein